MATGRVRSHCVSSAGQSLVQERGRGRHLGSSGRGCCAGVGVALSPTGDATGAGCQGGVLGPASQAAEAAGLAGRERVRPRAPSAFQCPRTTLGSGLCDVRVGYMMGRPGSTGSPHPGLGRPHPVQAPVLRPRTPSPHPPPPPPQHPQSLSGCSAGLGARVSGRAATQDPERRLLSRALPASLAQWPRSLWGPAPSGALLRLGAPLPLGPRSVWGPRCGLHPEPPAPRPQVRATAGELFQQVCDVAGLREAHFFGLSVVRSK